MLGKFEENITRISWRIYMLVYFVMNKNELNKMDIIFVLRIKIVCLD